jgi:PleD family two-component response regulator
LPGSTGCSISAGIAEFKPGYTADNWLRYADNALYKAKIKGRNQVVVFTKPIEASDN